MPRSYHAVELWEVKDLLVKMGYRFNGNRAFAIQLTKPDPVNKFRATGQPMRIPLQGIRKDTLQRILQYSEDARQAAQQVEALSLGAILEPDVGPANRQVQELDEAVIEKIVQRRTENVLAQKESAHEAEMALMRKQIEEMREQMASQPTTRKKTAKKAGKKTRKNRNVVQDTIEKVEEMEDGPELTDEQEALMKQVSFGHSQ